MREIRFRAWNGEYMLDSSYGDWISFDGVPYTEANNKYDTPNIEIIKAKNYVVMQYTGLKDKNGIEIYFNDLVKAPSGLIFEVIWHEEEMRIALMHRGAKYNSIYNFNVPLYEVIGNIYQHQELL